AVVILVWPDISLYALVILFGAFALANGVLGLGALLSGQVKQGRGWVLFYSLVGIGFGVAAFLNTNMTAHALLYVIGAYSIALGVITIGGAFWLPFSDGDSLILGLVGLIAVLFGVVMFASPGEGALVLLALIAAFALVTGVAELVVAIGGKRLVETRV